MSTYRATLSQSQGREGWSVIFRHPVLLAVARSALRTLWPDPRPGHRLRNPRPANEPGDPHRTSLRLAADDGRGGFGRDLPAL